MKKDEKAPLGPFLYWILLLTGLKNNRIINISNKCLRKEKR